VGGFDERLGPGTRLPAAEDNDLGLRLLEAGYRIRYVPEAVVEHRAWRGDGAYLPLRWRYARGQGAFYGKHLRWRDPFMRRRLVHAIRHRFGLCLASLRRDPRRALAHAVYLAGLLSGLVNWLLIERPPEWWRSRRLAVPRGLPPARRSAESAP